MYILLQQLPGSSLLVRSMEYSTTGERLSCTARLQAGSTIKHATIVCLVPAVEGPSMTTARELYPFQAAGVRFLTKKKSWAQGCSGGFLWDDPGLGKTIQAIVAARMMDKYPILVVCPNSLKRHWRQEIIATYPDTASSPGTSGSILVAGKAGRIVKVVSTNKRTGRQAVVEVDISPDSVAGASWVVVHYTGLRIAKKAYASIPWGTVIVDESHYVKNRRAARTAALLEVTPSRCHRIALTATPYSRDPSDLWAQLFWMAPTVPGLHNYWRFFNLFTSYKWELRHGGGKYRKIDGGKNLDVLAEVMATYGLCRRKTEVAADLPPITDTLMPLQMDRGSRQEVVYNALADVTRAEIAIGHTGPNAEPGAVTGLLIKNILSRIIRMERWLSNPAAMDPGVEGVKMAWLKEWASSFPYPAVVVTRFKSSAKVVAAALGARPITGDIPLRTRDSIIEGWRAGGDASRFLVGTIHTLGTGLNLERAYAMVCYDQVYSPILMAQARERVHRITSTHPVEVLYLVVEGTTNEVVYESFRRKWRSLEMVKRFIQMLEGKEWR